VKYLDKKEAKGKGRGATGHRVPLSKFLQEPDCSPEGRGAGRKDNPWGKKKEGIFVTIEKRGRRTISKEEKKGFPTINDELGRRQGNTNRCQGEWEPLFEGPKKRKNV